jgi:hypothetical protein
MLPFSLRDFCFAVRVEKPGLRFPPIRSVVCFASPLPAKRRARKEAERRQTRNQLLHLPAQRALCGRARLSAFHRGSCQGDSWSPRLSVRPCFGRQSGAFDPVRPLQPGSGDLALFHGRYPRRKNERRNCPRTVSTSHAGHSAGGLMPDAARDRVVSPPAGTALAPLSVLPSAEGVLHRARFDNDLVSEFTTIVKQ